jgi:hypothetical protein
MFTSTLISSSVLEVIGDEAVVTDRPESKASYMLQHYLSTCTLQGALMSVYGVDNFDAITAYQYNDDSRELDAAKHNASLVGLAMPMRRVDVFMRAAFWLKTHIRDNEDTLFLPLSTRLHKRLKDLIISDGAASEQVGEVIGLEMHGHSHVNQQ